MTDNDEAHAGGKEQRFEITRGEFLKGGLAAGVAVASGGVLAACGASKSTTTTGPQKLRQGGSMTIGTVGGTQDTVLPFASFTDADNLRQFALYESLTQVRGNLTQLIPYNELAEELIPNSKGDVWTIRLKSGVEFHNGKTLDVDDFIYTTKLMTDPKLGAFNYGRFILFDIAAAKKLDSVTIRVPMTKPVAILPEMMGCGALAGIVPVGFDFKHPVGTGPFKLVSFTPGQSTVLERFPNYWGEQAKVDKFTLLVLPDDTARYNALISGQIDVLDEAPLDRLASLEANPSYHVSNLQSAGWLPMYMRVDLAPFDDVRVRQAMRLCLDRTQMIETAFFGHAAHGSDIFGRFDPEVDTSLVRNQDLSQAKFLLKQAGKEGVTVTMTTADIGPGSLECCQVLAQNAKAAGFNFVLREVDSGTMFGPNYLSWPFAIDDWPGYNYLILITQNSGPGATVNETHFHNARFDALFEEAFAEQNANRRTEIAHELQMIDFNEGGNIIPAFPNYAAAYTTKVGGFYPANLTGQAVASGFLNKLGFLA